jgi:hypothetical protein
MKIRDGFVSNSSSSSFVVAVRDDCTEEDIKKALLDKAEGAIYDFIENDFDWVKINYNDIGDLTEKALMDKILDILSVELLDNFHSNVYSNFLQIGEWKVASMYCSSEDGEMLCTFLYQHLGELISEKLKLKSTN